MASSPCPHPLPTIASHRSARTRKMPYHLPAFLLCGWTWPPATVPLPQKSGPSTRDPSTSVKQQLLKVIVVFLEIISFLLDPYGLKKANSKRSAKGLMHLRMPAGLPLGYGWEKGLGKAVVRSNLLKESNRRVALFAPVLVLQNVFLESSSDFQALVLPQHYLLSQVLGEATFPMALHNCFSGTERT